jgi:8-oxo-dGTP diphosphatase
VLCSGDVGRALFDRLPAGALPILKEVARHLLRRPVVGVSAVARRSDGQILLVKRGDTGTWGLPGGTLEWGEPAREALRRELQEEAGAALIEVGRLLGVYTDPARDTRMHSVTLLVEATVHDHIEGPENPLEIHEARFFPVSEVPRPLAYTGDEMLTRALREAAPYWE